MEIENWFHRVTDNIGHVYLSYITLKIFLIQKELLIHTALNEASHWINKFGGNKKLTGGKTK